MAIYDSSRGGYRVFVGDLGSRVGKYELEINIKIYLDKEVESGMTANLFLVFSSTFDILNTMFNKVG
jgi:hypothetical protein